MKVVGVSCDSKHNFSKPQRDAIRLLKGLGVEGDAHLGVTVQHLSRIKRDPTVPNLRQVHLMHAELHDEMRAEGFEVAAGDLGENITTRGIDLLALPRDARLHIGTEAIVEIKGLRNPCYQIDDFRKGLLRVCIDKDADGNLIRKAGVMGIVLAGGTVKPGDPIRVDLPDGPHNKLTAI